ncbi:hypothetical protein KCG44_01940 [Pacificimonas sp. WHA3]|uniref:Uncharacterized protein n=1 Tax=Pacificimonas pallii TaxID=2827236 RepID=A0ABS6SCA6_9SPHN|nr:hypothetical protein [Pacificimonas pallii]MBV7255541.1 hypothetical protein [Pacificimonas pallii]
MFAIFLTGAAVCFALIYKVAVRKADIAILGGTGIILGLTGIGTLIQTVFGYDTLLRDLVWAFTFSATDVYPLALICLIRSFFRGIGHKLRIAYIIGFLLMASPFILLTIFGVAMTLNS